MNISGLKGDCYASKRRLNSTDNTGQTLSPVPKTRLRANRYSVVAPVQNKPRNASSHHGHNYPQPSQAAKHIKNRRRTGQQSLIG